MSVRPALVGPTLRISQCSHLVIRGFVVQGTPTRGPPTPPAIEGPSHGAVHVDASHSVELRDLLVHGDSPVGIEVVNGADVWVAAAEVVSGFDSHGILLRTTQRARVTGCFLQRDARSVGMYQTGIRSESSQGVFITNTIVEGYYDAFALRATEEAMEANVPSALYRLHGCIALRPSQTGFVFHSSCGSASPCDERALLTDVHINDSVAWGAPRAGIDARSVRQLRATRFTSYGVAGRDFHFHPSSSPDNFSVPLQARFDVADSLDYGGGQFGVYVSDSRGAVRRSESYGNDTALYVINSEVGPVEYFDFGTGADPQMGDCALWPTPNATAGQQFGVPIGSDLRFVYEGEVVDRSQPLWMGGNGVFRFCGRVVEGVNDGPLRCDEVHQRLFVDRCPLPE